MLNSTQRSKLKSLANTLNPIFHIGKGGINDNLVNDINTALDAHELIKIAVLRNADTSAKDMLEEVCSRTGAEAVIAIGSKFVVYKRSRRDDVKHIEI